MKAKGDVPARNWGLWITFVLICIPILVGSIDLTAIVVVLPQATLELLGPRGLERADLALWAVTAYLLAYTISLAVLGRLSDVLPRKAVFIGCIVIFFFGALWAGMATGLPLQALSSLPIWPDPDLLPLISLIIGRVIQAIGTGASVSVGMALVGDLFPPDRRSEPISLISALDSLGWVIGNLYAGLMLQILPSWRYLFLINAGIALVALIFTAIALSRARNYAAPSTLDAPSAPRERPRFDALGALLFGGALVALTIGVESMSKPHGLPLVLCSLGVFVIFYFVQRRMKHALIDMRFVMRREVRPALVANLIVGFALILIVAGVPLVVNLRAVFLRGEGLLSGALQAGLMLCALTIPLIAAVIVGENRYKRIGAAIPVSAGLAVAILGFLLTMTWTYTAPTLVLAFPLSLVGLGLGLTMGPLSLVVMDEAEDSTRGLASSLVLVMRLLGMTVGTPLAATLTLSLANQWADERAQVLPSLFQAIARPMLVPPMAVDALARVMLIGAAACAVGLFTLYMRRAYRSIWHLSYRPRVLTSGLPLLGAVVFAVIAVSAWSSIVSPAVLPNPVARQLPQETELYIGANIQQLFLLNSRRPLQAVVNLLEGVINGPSAPLTATVPMSAMLQDNALAPANPAEPPQQDDTPPQPQQPSDTPTDIIVKFLFQPAQWSNMSYAPFCPAGIPESDYQWCFNNGLLSWIGPQAAFALMPGADGTGQYDFLFAFQATNRNNAVKFAAALAEAMEEPSPAELRPNVHLVEFVQNSITPRALAITDAYVLIGTPGAVRRTLNLATGALADRSDYQAMITTLPPNEFATLYYQARTLAGALRPALLGVLPPEKVDMALRMAARLAPQPFTELADVPVQVGVGIRLNETQVRLDTVANMPFDMPWFAGPPVEAGALGLIADDASMWLAAHLNLAQSAGQADIATVLETLAAESGDVALAELLENPLVRGPILAFGNALRDVLAHAAGPVAIMRDTDHAWLILPLVDQTAGSARAAVEALRPLLQSASLIATTAGVPFSIESLQVDGYGAEIIRLGGALVEVGMPGGLAYTLTPDNVLIVGSAGDLGALIGAATHGGSSASRLVDQVFTDDNADPARFFYGYLIPPSSGDPAALLVGGKLSGRTLYLDAVLQTR